MQPIFNPILHSSDGLNAFAGARHINLDELRITQANTTIHNHSGHSGAGRSTGESDVVHVGAKAQTNKESEDLHQLLNPLDDASHMRNRKMAPPDSQCMSGTREDVFRQLHSWVKNGIMKGRLHNAIPTIGESTLRKPMCWMYGSFGCGKSAVAQSIAEVYAHEGRLAACFFFFRNSGDRSRIVRFIATLAYQIALNVPGCRVIIERAIRENQGLLGPSCSLEWQIQKLLHEPLLACLRKRWYKLGSKRKPYLVLIDGLDECEDKEGVSTFIDQSIAFFSRNPDIPLRFLITSRVEEHIRTHIEGGAAVIHLFDLASRSSRADIEHFMEAFFADAKRHDRALHRLGEDWPSQQDLVNIVDYCDGSFIFASTLARFIIGASGDSDPRTPVERLSLALAINTGIDGVYEEVLARAQHLPHFHKIISTIVYLEKPLSISAISLLLNISTYDTTRVLVQLQAIINVPGRDDLPITVFHISLRDFLVDRNRSGRLHSPESHHIFLVHHCLELLVGAEPTANTECNKYAMMYWAAHLTTAVTMKGNEFLSGPYPTLRSNAPYRPIDVREWSRRQYKSSRGERRPVTTPFLRNEWNTMMENEQRLINEVHFSDDGYDGQPLAVDPNDVTSRWSVELRDRDEDLYAKIKSRQICSLKDVALGLYMTKRSNLERITSMKRGMGVSVALQVNTLLREITISDDID